MQKGDKFYEETEELDDRGNPIKKYYTLWELISNNPTGSKIGCQKWFIKYNNDNTLYKKWVDPTFKIEE